MSVAVSCRGLSVTLGGAPVLRDVGLDVEAGAWVSLVGPNGAGKTTLLRAIAGVQPAAEAMVGGRPVAGLSARERARTLALVPQRPHLPTGMSVTDYVSLGRTPHIPFFGVEGGDDRAVVADVLAQLQLVNLTGRRMETLSGGERQRAVLARALAQEAPLLLLDEPTTALDVGHQQEVLELVEELRQARRLTVVSSTHDLTLAGQYADRLVMLDGGRVVAIGRAEHVLTEERLARHYGARVRVVHGLDGIVVLPIRRTSGAGEDVRSSRKAGRHECREPHIEEAAMPKVNPESGEPMSDDPEGPSDLAGGKGRGDPDLPSGSNPTGSSSATQQGRDEDPSETESPGPEAGSGTGRRRDTGS